MPRSRSLSTEDGNCPLGQYKFILTDSMYRNKMLTITVIMVYLAVINGNTMDKWGYN